MNVGRFVQVGVLNISHSSSKGKMNALYGINIMRKICNHTLLLSPQERKSVSDLTEDETRYHILGIFLKPQGHGSDVREIEGHSTNPSHVEETRA